MHEKRDIKRIEQEKERWEAETVKPTLKNAPERA